MTVPFAKSETGELVDQSVTLELDILDRLMPLHLLLSGTGHIMRTGPTLRKLWQEGDLVGQRFLEAFSVRRPQRATSFSDIAEAENGRLKLALRGGKKTSFTGLVVGTTKDDLLLINLSFGIGLVDAVRSYDLSGADFAVTDLTLEMLYLFEAKSAALNASEKLNRRLKGAKSVAEEQALTDTLTGLRNRRAMDIALSQLIDQGASFAIMHLDLDFFKQVNDTLGHAAGDLVLEKVGRVLRHETRAGDHVARVGGDEFVILFRELVDPSRLTGTASRIIEALEEPIAFRDSACRVSASVGITLSSFYRSPDPDQMLSDADEALYASKRGGRGQATIFTKDLSA